MATVRIGKQRLHAWVPGSCLVDTLTRSVNVPYDRSPRTSTTKGGAEGNGGNGGAPASSSGRRSISSDACTT